MKEIRITRTFLKNPANSVIILFSIAALFEGIQWSAVYSAKIALTKKAGGILPYAFVIIRELFIPELITLLITITLLNLWHKYFNIHTIKSEWRSIMLYEIKFLPLILIAFPIFNPFTQTFRFIIDSYPNYSWTHYWNEYILYTFHWRMYFQYLFPLVILSYIPLNISLFQDYLKQRKEAAKKEAVESFRKTLQLPVIPATRATTYISYLTSLKGRNAQGELDFPINDVYYFTIEERLYYAELAKGRYLISKTLNELEAELDPRQFFRIKRDYIVNRQAIQSYSHWENGKYIVRLNTPKSQDIVIPRTRMQELREWLQKDVKELLEVT